MHDLHEPRDVYASEWRELRERRRVQLGQPPDPSPGGPPGMLAGLALSGGGIRSATFGLGVLQALNDRRLLRPFDYVSTVSGGGFVGGFWSAWLARMVAGARRAAGAGPAPPSLFPGREQPEPARYAASGGQPPPIGVHADPIHQVRLFSNYLTPRTGLLSPDVWRATVVAGRNIGLTWLVLVPLLAVALTVSHAILVLILHAFRHAITGAGGLYSSSPQPGGVLVEWAWHAFTIPAVLASYTGVLSLLWLILQRGASRAQAFAIAGAMLALLAMILPAVVETAGRPAYFWLLGAAVLGGAALLVIPQQENEPHALYYDRIRTRLTHWHTWLLMLTVLVSGAFAAAAFGPELVKQALTLDPGSAGAAVAAWTGRLTAVGGVLGAVFAWFSAAPRAGGDEAASARQALPRLVAAVTPLLVLIVLVCGISWAISMAMTTLGAVPGHSQDALIALDRMSLVGVWLAIALAALEPCAYRLAERLPLLGMPAVAAAAFTARSVVAWLHAGAAAPWLPLASVVLAIAGGLYALREWRRHTLDENRRTVLLMLFASVALVVLNAGTFDSGWMPPIEVRLLAGLTSTLMTIVLVLGWTVDPNALSLHALYKSRLTRAYLGASNPRRAVGGADDITRPEADDNLKLTALAAPSDGVPLHLINTTLNLVGTNDLAVAQRRAASFVLARHYCGSMRTGFRRTSEYMSGAMSLGTAVAVSGAAASPNMGSQTPSAALAMLMAFLNVRLGYWAPTPRGSEWRAPQARLWPFYLLREFFSRTSDGGSFCYLTDGGHFDNTGIYPLVERGCSYILAADCGADPETALEDLAKLVRRARIDFGAEITFAPIAPVLQTTPADRRRPWLVGEIRYSQAHLASIGWEDPPASHLGILVVIKPTLAGALDLDVRRYSQVAREFPQQATVDQWYDEAQFESYRRLGERSCEALLAPLQGLEAFREPVVTNADVERLFAQLHADAFAEVDREARAV